ncbi:MAG TPA: hypothetical protein GXZ89_06570 [Fastidiosipila sp.]|nr:hypothetical protein [Fastidiosipila sp.]
MTKDDLKEKISEALLLTERFILGIDGMAGSGKSRLAVDLAERYHGKVIRLDHFYLPVDKRDRKDGAEAASHMDFARFRSEVLEPLRQGQPATHRVFSCQSQSFVGEREAGSSGLIVIEGSYALHPAIASLYDATVFLTVDRAVQEARLKAREGDYYPVFEAEWLPREKAYHARFQPEQKADYVIDTSQDEETVLYLVRHGVTSGNIDRIIQGQFDVPLAAEGMAQAEKLGTRLLDYRIDHAYTSDLQRANETARLILEAHDETKIVATKLLREIDMGEMQGQKYDYCRERYADVFEQLKDDPMGVRSPGGETGDEVLARGKTFLKKILSEHKNEVLLAVSHGYILNLILQSLSSDFGFDTPPTVFANTALTKLIFSHDRLVEIPLINDTSHLD